MLWVVVLCLLLLPALALADERTVTTTITVPDTTLVYSIWEAEQFANKLKEIGVGAVLTVGGGATTYLMGKSMFVAYRETRALAAENLSRFVSSLAGGGIAGAVAGGMLKAGGKVVGKGAKLAGGVLKKGVGKLSEVRKRSVSPADFRVPDSLLSGGGVGVGRTVTTDSLFKGEVGSSKIDALKVGDQEFKLTDLGPATKDGELVSEKKLSSLVSQAGQAEVTYSDGTKAVLQKEGDKFREYFPASELEKVDPKLLSSGAVLRVEESKVSSALRGADSSYESKALTKEQTLSYLSKLQAGTEQKAVIRTRNNFAVVKRGKDGYLELEMTKDGNKPVAGIHEDRWGEVKKEFYKDGKKLYTSDAEFYDKLLEVLNRKDVGSPDVAGRLKKKQDN